MFAVEHWRLINFGKKFSRCTVFEKYDHNAQKCGFKTLPASGHVVCKNNL